MKVRLYAGDMLLNRKKLKKKYVEIQKKEIFYETNGENFFVLVQMFYRPMGYLDNVLNAPPIFLWYIERP